MGQTYYWVLAEKDGKKTLQGAFTFAEKAEEAGKLASDGDNYEVFSLQTIDKTSAKSQIKEILFQRTHDLHYSLQPIKKPKEDIE
jgi:hypothetical protein